MHLIRLIFEKIQGIIDARLTGTAEPEPDELSEIQDYEKRKAGDTIELKEFTEI